LKESVPLSLIGLGVFAVQGRGQGKRVGVGFIVFGLVSFAVIMKVVYPTFRHGEETM
jgi:hypothetical protein